MTEARIEVSSASASVFLAFGAPAASLPLRTRAQQLVRLDDVPASPLHFNDPPTARESYARARQSKVEKWVDEIVPMRDKVIGQDSDCHGGQACEFGCSSIKCCEALPQIQAIGNHHDL